MPTAIKTEPAVDHPVDLKLILAPAGNKAAFLAALAAGADAIYCGLKDFSARMEAKNFSIDELERLIQLAHQKNTKVFVALNALLKPDEMNAACAMISDLIGRVQPDGLIIQDLGILELLRKLEFKGEIHLSTLANVTFPESLVWVKEKLGVARVVLPRELNVDEIKSMATACPSGMDLEVFIHGALCYGVSGRCYWSSWFGGKSGLRGRCVQPCRRIYQHRQEKNRFFACQDFSIDVLTKVLKEIEAVKVWKIEGRKKGPHYVFYTVSAYRLLRDHHQDAARKRDALALLESALGRRGTHYNFLPQRPQNPIDPERQTGSGLLVGRVQGGAGTPYLVPRTALMPNDVLRIGYEDQEHHTIQRVNRHVPKKGRLYLKVSERKGSLNGAPVFLTDRREKALDNMISELETELKSIKIKTNISISQKQIGSPARFLSKEKCVEMVVHRSYEGKNGKGLIGLWLSNNSLQKLPKTIGRRVWWWLPPVVWPENQAQVRADVNLALSLGSQNFVLNAPWQMAFFSTTERLQLWAGPFCNATNPMTLALFKRIGFSGVIAAPELGRSDYELLVRNAPLPLGIVISGFWPLCISRTIAGNTSVADAFMSPKQEAAWIRPYDSNYWVFPNWRLDLSSKKSWLEQQGYRLFVHFAEKLPRKVSENKRPGLWNWNVGLK